MKKLLSIALACGLLINLTSCKTANKEEAKVPDGMMALDLSKFGKSFIIFIPDSTKGKVEVTEQSWGALEIKVGQDFQISIKEGDEDLAFKKTDLQGDEINKVKQFHVDEPTTLLWESVIGEGTPEFHFISVQKVGNAAYTFEDIKSTDNKPFTKAAVDKMLESVKGITPTKKEENS